MSSYQDCTIGCSGPPCEHHPWRPFRDSDLQLPPDTPVLINGRPGGTIGSNSDLCLPGGYPFLAGIARHARRRAMRSVRHGEVHVVTLRRALSARPEGEHGHRDVDWSCHWVVQGFWRHTEDYSELARHHRAVPGSPVPGKDGWYYCQACAAIVTWVRPHLRGPKDKPLKATKQLYRLSR